MATPTNFSETKHWLRTARTLTEALILSGSATDAFSRVQFIARGWPDGWRDSSTVSSVFPRLVIVRLNSPAPPGATVSSSGVNASENLNDRSTCTTPSGSRRVQSVPTAAVTE